MAPMRRDDFVMNRDAILRMLKSGKSEELKALSSAEVEQFLLAVVRDSETAPAPPDFDRLLGIGIGLARAQHEDADTAVLQWLRERPSDRRLDIVSALLNGLWDTAYRRRPVPAGSVGTLIDSHNAIAPGPDAEYGFVQALAKALESQPAGPLRDKIEAMLAAAVQRTYPPPLDRLMKSVIENALRHARE